MKKEILLSFVSVIFFVAQASSPYQWDQALELVTQEDEEPPSDFSTRDTFPFLEYEHLKDLAQSLQLIDERDEKIPPMVIYELKEDGSCTALSGQPQDIWNAVLEDGKDDMTYFEDSRCGGKEITLKAFNEHISQFAQNPKKSIEEFEQTVENTLSRREGNENLPLSAIEEQATDGHIFDGL